MLGPVSFLAQGLADWVFGKPKPALPVAMTLTSAFFLKFVSATSIAFSAFHVLPVLTLNPADDALQFLCYVSPLTGLILEWKLCLLTHNVSLCILHLSKHWAEWIQIFYVVTQ